MPRQVFMPSMRQLPMFPMSKMQILACLLNNLKQVGFIRIYTTVRSKRLIQLSPRFIIYEP